MSDHPKSMYTQRYPSGTFPTIEQDTLAPLDAVLNAMSEGVLIVDQNHCIIHINQRAVEILRIPREMLIGFDLWQTQKPLYSESGEIISFSEHPCTQALESGTMCHGRIIGISRADATPLWLVVNTSMLDTIPGMESYLLVSFTDITSQRNNDEALKRSEMEYRLLTEHSSDIICKHDGRGIFLYVSPAATPILGYSPNELIGQHPSLFVHPDDWEHVLALYTSVKHNTTRTVSFRFRNKSGKYTCLENTVKTLKISHDPGDSVIITVSRDISERMKIEMALRESEMRYRALFDNASDAIYIHDLSGNFIEVNSVALEQLGYTREELSSISPTSIQPPSQAEKFQSRISTLLRNQYLVYETVLIRKNGSSYPVELSMKLIQYGARRVVMSIGRNITERKQFESELERSVALLRASIESTADGILVQGTSGEIITYNKRFRDIWDLPPDWGARGIHHDFTTYMREKVKIVKDFDNSSETHDNPEETSYDIIEMENGRLYERCSFPFKVGDRIAGRSLSFRDITSRTLAEQELRNSRAQLKAIFDNAGVAIGLLSPEGRFVIVNERWAEMFGTTTEDIYRQPPLAFSHPDEVDKGHFRLNAVLSGKLSSYRIEKRYIRKDGTLIWGDLFVTPIRDEFGNLQSVLGIITEITNSKNAEQALQKSNKELEQRNEELDAFAHTVAHDLRNPLGVIIGYAHLIRDHKDELIPEEIDAVYNGVLECARKMQSIIDSLLLLARIRNQEIERHPVQMHRAIHEAMKHLEPLISERKAEITVPDIWPQVLGYEPWIEEVWANYLSNAIKYGGTPPIITLGFDEEPDFIRFWIRDNGAGIPLEDQSILFNKFIRLAESESDGQGLGLSIVRRIIEKLNGKTGVKSETGEGSVFFFTLPRT